jgi:hypothetical protein
MAFAVSYSLLEGQQSRERIWPSVLRLWLDVSQKYIPQSQEFTDIKTIISRCAPILAACLPHVSAPVSVLGDKIRKSNTHINDNGLISYIVRVKLETSATYASY